MSRWNRIGFVVNPNAGRGKSRGLKVAIDNMLRDKQFAYSVVETSSPMHGTVVARELAKDHDLVVAVGGDGTVHEVAEGLLGTSAVLGVLSTGSGNDFGRSSGSPKRIDSMLEYFELGSTRKWDIGSLKITDSDGSTKEAIFVNTLGIGLDAAISKEARSISWLRGVPLYLYAAIKSILAYGDHSVRVSSRDGKQMEDRCLLLCVGNNEYEGGGFKMTPGAAPDDGKFKFCLVKTMKKGKIFRVLPTAISGKHEQFDTIVTWEGSEAVIELSPGAVVHADGEILSVAAERIEIHNDPGVLNVLCGPQGNQL